MIKIYGSFDCKKTVEAMHYLNKKKIKWLLIGTAEVSRNLLKKLKEKENYLVYCVYQTKIDVRKLEKLQPKQLHEKVEDGTIKLRTPFFDIDGILEYGDITKLGLKGENDIDYVTDQDIQAVRKLLNADNMREVSRKTSASIQQLKQLKNGGMLPRALIYRIKVVIEQKGKFGGGTDGRLRND